MGVAMKAAGCRRRLVVSGKVVGVAAECQRLFVLPNGDEDWKAGGES